jgi:GNAT superfamily N-acetyltransferase
MTTDAWKPLWDEYNAFYERTGPTALPDEVTETTWRRFFDASEPVHCIVAERDGKVLGLCHYLFHRSTSRIENVCYLQDLFTHADERGHGIGRALIMAV